MIELLKLGTAVFACFLSTLIGNHVFGAPRWAVFLVSAFVGVGCLLDEREGGGHVER